MVAQLPEYSKTTEFFQYVSFIVWELYLSKLLQKVVDIRYNLVSSNFCYPNSS